MTTGILHDQNLEKQIEKQMGCMAGFLQIFDRNQIIAGKRLYATKRLPPSPVVDASESGSSVGSPVVVREFVRQEHPRSAPSPDRLKPSVAPEERSPGPEIVTPANGQTKLPLPLPVCEFKEGTRSSWKFKEAPRLSLDSRAVVDARGSIYPREIRTNAAILSASRFENSTEAAAADDGDKHRRSPSVIARLMGLDQLPHSCPEPVKKAELRRSASESRVSKDLLQCRFVDGNNFQLKQSPQSNSGSSISGNVFRDNARGVEHRASNGRAMDPYPMEYTGRNVQAEPPRSMGSSQWKSPQQRKSFFDSEDFFPEPKQTVSISGEIERRLKMRGIDEPARDLETLKQILEALQLKGLLHSQKPTNQSNHRNFVYDRSFPSHESPIVVIKPGRSPASTRRPVRTGKESPPPPTSRTKPMVRRNANLSGETLPSMSPRNVRNQTRAQNSSSPTRAESSVKALSSLTTRKVLNVEVQRKSNDSTPQLRRVSPVHSPKLSPRRTGPDHSICRSPRNKKPTAEICSPVPVPIEDESSSISGSSISTSSHSDSERSKLEGKNLLERCDKLLHSIAEITASELQPSPVSVLDSSFYKDESSPSPVMKRSIDFRELDDEVGSPESHSVELKFEEEPEDCDFLYVSEILQASNYLPEDCDVFLLLEKQQFLKGKDASKVSTLERKLIFDTITEIINRKRKLPPWKAAISISSSGKSSLQQIWAEFIRIRERETSEDMFDIICGVLRKDLACDSISGWGDCPLEKSDAVLDIERLIFKDLVGETIRDLAAFSGKIRAQAAAAASRRKLVF